MVTTAGDPNPLLKLTNTSILKKFLHQCVDELTGKPQENFNNSMNDLEWSSEEHKLARNFIHSLYKNHIFEGNLSDSNLTDLSSSHIEEVRTCFKIRKDDIHRAVIKEQLLKSNIPLVESFDWKLKWVIGSSKLSSLSEPLVQIDLNCISNRSKDKFDVDNNSLDADRSNTINFEMNLTQLDKLIKEFEEIKQQF